MMTFVLKEPDFAQGLVAGNEFGREVARADIRRTQAKALRALKRLNRKLFSVRFAAFHEEMRLAVKAIDAATRKPRTAKAK
jgi:hypothetical protein